ncbi:hypothetical protein HDF16_004004 [Granulicella aggregans]|uniref:Fibronectin type-III domain-containing protein n=1 Tax=Granulicella aggregans TaxID=474949 RepID=A0A7W8E558_9BACT|nr:hypothetical protein [Granulicella aggregans]MBB5059281.1 hypothetical protein [Granulicella aggregans]
MANVVLGLQAGIASGAEATFDGQPMQRGTHLRWGFSPELGFPPGGFWLCRKEIKGVTQPSPTSSHGNESSLSGAISHIMGEASTMLSRVADSLDPASATQPSNECNQQPAAVSATGVNQWVATPPRACESVTVAGCAADGCEEVIIETFSKDANGELHVSKRQIVRVESGGFRVRIAAREISCVRVVGAGSVDECGCEVLPPTCCDGGKGGGGNGGGQGPPGNGGDPGWGDPGRDGWQCWRVPFTLPLTLAKWPARYHGAPNPATTPPSVVQKDDIKEALRRLGTLQLSEGLSATQQRKELETLRVELIRLVQGYPTVLQADVPLSTSPSAANAPNLNLNLIQQLLLLALDPYFARVLGLYFVDEDTAPGVIYEYRITGYWGLTSAQSDVVYPGLAQAAPLARGLANFDGMSIQALNNSSLWRWTRDDANGNYRPLTDPAAPFQVNSTVSTALAGFIPAQQPAALLAVFSKPVLFGFPAPPPEVSIKLPHAYPQVDIQIAGRGTVFAFAEGVLVASTSFNSAQLQTATAVVANPDTPIDAIGITGLGGVLFGPEIVLVGSLRLHLIAPDMIGTRFAIAPATHHLIPLAAPGDPIATFRHRQADVDPATLTLVPHSLFDVEWPAPDLPTVTPPGNPITDPGALPPPTLPIGFVAEREDTGKPSSIVRIAERIVAAGSPTPAHSKITSKRLYRLADNGVVDPITAYSYRVAGFDIFGALGKWSHRTAALPVEKIAAAPTQLRILQFDNTSANGGAPSADGSAWVGGRLIFNVNWSGAAFLMYPDVETARINIEFLDIATGVPAGTLTTADITLPARNVQALTVASVDVTPSGDGSTWTVDIQTTPALPALGVRDPAAVLMLTLADGTNERYVVRPSNPNDPNPGPITARIKAGAAARIVATPAAFVNQPAYLVSGYGKQMSLSVPMNIPIDQQTARARLSVTGSTKNPFDATEQIIDPNGINPPRPEPQSVALAFTGPQRLVPPAPPTPVHDVHHVYYDPADFTGSAGKTLPFDTSAPTGISGYILERAAVRSLILADLKRRGGNAVDNNPSIAGRPDLTAWITEVPAWITAYNALNGTTFTTANVLNDAAAQRAFVDHFYGGLLDDELRALADVDANLAGFARVNTQPVPPKSAISDAVDGTGFGRNLYKLAAVNASGSVSGVTGSIGPYYTRIVTPPRPPVFYKLQATQSAIIAAWALDSNPDVAAYIIYRAGTAASLTDLRYFGADPTHPVAPSALAATQFNPKVAQGVSFGAGLLDPRIIGLTPDPRLCARDYEDSDAGEIALPIGPAPDAINGVYRLAEYDAKLDPLAQKAFNYWTPPAKGGIAQLIIDTLTQSRLTGLRIGLGRGVPVVVVATFAGKVKVFGQVPIRRAAFVDGFTSGGTPADPNAISGAPSLNLTGPNFYCIVAVDIFGNLSTPSKAFSAQLLALASGS